MKTWMLMLLLMGSAEALTPSHWVLDTIEPYPGPRPTYNLSYVTSKYVYRVQLPGPPSSSTYLTQCGKAVLLTLKATPSARLQNYGSEGPQVFYYVDEGVYTADTYVSARNSRGVRADTAYTCDGVYQGNSQRGTLYLAVRKAEVP